MVGKRLCNSATHFFLKSLLNLLLYSFSYLCSSFLAMSMWDLRILAPQSENKPELPVLQGKVLTTGPPRKSL